MIEYSKKNIEIPYYSKKSDWHFIACTQILTGIKEEILAYWCAEKQMWNVRGEYINSKEIEISYMCPAPSYKSYDELQKIQIRCYLFSLPV